MSLENISDCYDKKSSNKRKQVDMSTVPACLLEEGFGELNEIEEVIPSYLKHPVCHEILLCFHVYSLRTHSL